MQIQHFICVRKKMIITNYYFLEMKENRFLRLWLGLHLISCRSGGKKVVDTPCIDILHWESLESPRAVHLWYRHSQQNKKHLHLLVQKRFFHKYFCDNVWGCIFKKEKKTTLFFHCLPYILWVGLVWSPCLDIFKTDSVFPSMDLQSTSTRQLVWTCCPVPTSNLNPPFTLPLCNAVSQEELQPPDKRNPTLAVGQAALGRSASSSPPTTTSHPRCSFWCGSGVLEIPREGMDHRRALNMWGC